jgi:hypothetical protein
MAAQPLVLADLDVMVERRRLANIALAGLVAIALGQFADLITFVHMITSGGFGTEANPIVIQLAGTLGLNIVLLLKVALVPFLALVFVVLARLHASRLAASVVTIATLAGLFGALSNILTFA